MTDRAWVAVHKAVLAGLRDADVMHRPPVNEQELDWLADTVADHVIGAVDEAARRALAKDE